MDADPVATEPPRQSPASHGMAEAARPGSAITALLGPTNTGKTHRAVERMLAYPTGMIGLPLRLLAREVYDRITTRVGEARVALVTGEEKRVPRRPDYWVCTVEAMPVDREVDFLAVDEIQLAAHDGRGHVFTERLLRARGREETWFMGADTMRPLVREIVPTAVHAHCARLSRLSYAGADKLTRLPPRSAVVAFSMPEVYLIAERLRATRGGAAVVLGALSPRTRNAQVALFQSGEVDYLVATDAIGMGLNLDVCHVAFASVRKFDGREARDLEPDEIAQIAGRAGRYLRDGTFGTLAPARMPEPVAAAVEAHHFHPLRRLWYRNPDLDTRSLDALLASLRDPPRLACLRRIDDPDDTAALARLALDPAVRARAKGREAVALLWEVCSIPDYRKLLLETHVALLGELYQMLAGPAGVIDAAWIRATVDEIDDVQGDIDTLTARLAAIRTFTYISHKTRWLKGAATWQDRTRAVEDRLSDALHERLVQRFVERGKARRAPATPPAKTAKPGEPRFGAPLGRAEETSRHHPFAALASMRVARAEPAAAGEQGDASWVEAVVSAPHERFSLDAAGKIGWEERTIASLTRGTALLLPEVKLIGLEHVGPGARSRLLRRLVAFARDLVSELLGPLRADEMGGLSPAGRGVAYQIEQGLGTALAASAGAQLAELSPRDHALFEASGVTLGGRALYLGALLRPRAVERRAALAAAWFDPRSRPAVPRPSAVSMRAPPGADARAYTAIGFPIFGPRAVRADVVERARRALAEQSGEHLPSLLGCPAREASAVAEALSAPPPP